MDVGALLAGRGLLLESAKGPIPNVAQLVAGEPIRGSWWGHSASQEIFAVINELAESPDVARMRLVRGKVTLVHRRLWSPLLRVADRLPVEALLVVGQEHTPSGAHRATATPLRDWVPADVRAAADALTATAAVALLPPHLPWLPT